MSLKRHLNFLCYKSNYLFHSSCLWSFFFVFDCDQKKTNWYHSKFDSDPLESSDRYVALVVEFRNLSSMDFRVWSFRIWFFNLESDSSASSPKLQLFFKILKALIYAHLNTYGNFNLWFCTLEHILVYELFFIPYLLAVWATTMFWAI
jgi:hypothetical protein